MKRRCCNKTACEHMLSISNNVFITNKTYVHMLSYTEVTNHVILKSDVIRSVYIISTGTCMKDRKKNAYRHEVETECPYNSTGNFWKVSKFPLSLFGIVVHKTEWVLFSVWTKISTKTFASKHIVTLISAECKTTGQEFYMGQGQWGEIWRHWAFPQSRIHVLY